MTNRLCRLLLFGPELELSPTLIWSFHLAVAVVLISLRICSLFSFSHLECFGLDAGDDSYLNEQQVGSSFSQRNCNGLSYSSRSAGEEGRLASERKELGTHVGLVVMRTDGVDGKPNKCNQWFSFQIISELGESKKVPDVDVDNFSASPLSRRSIRLGSFSDDEEIASFDVELRRLWCCFCVT